MVAVEREPGSGRWGAWLLLYLATAGAAACLALIYRSMRSVMAVGGSCASGGPYAVATPCPKGVGWVLPLAIWVGLAMLAGASAAAVRLGVPGIAWLAWPALFLSLGWNFVDFGLHPPGPRGGPIWSWLVCGAMFWAMGAGPVVLWLLNPQDRPTRSRPAPDGRTARAVKRASALGTTIRIETTPPPFRPSSGAGTGSWPGDGGGEASDLVDALERLDALHRSGAIDDAEFRDAKRRLIDGAG